MAIDNSQLEKIREEVDAATRRVNELLGEYTREKLEEDLKLLRAHNQDDSGKFAYIFTSCTDKNALKEYYDLIKKYDVYGANEITEDLIEELKWEIKKLKVFDGLGD